LEEAWRLLCRGGFAAGLSDGVSSGREAGGATFNLGGEYSRLVSFAEEDREEESDLEQPRPKIKTRLKHPIFVRVLPHAHFAGADPNKNW
jgi:hypothetical protein